MSHRKWYCGLIVRWLKCEGVGNHQQLANMLQSQDTLATVTAHSSKERLKGWNTFQLKAKAWLLACNGLLYVKETILELLGGSFSSFGGDWPSKPCHFFDHVTSHLTLPKKHKLVNQLSLTSLLYGAYLVFQPHKAHYNTSLHFIHTLTQQQVASL